MIALFDSCRPHIAELCRRYGVSKLELFGSAARDDFDETQSDVDLFFEFDSVPMRLADRFFGLKEELERLFGRSVDLVSSRDVRNPYFLRVANQHRVTLYAA